MSDDHSCPVCGYEIDEPARDEHGYASFEICDSCGTQFGYDDATRPHEELRRLWIRAGMPWWRAPKKPPHDWDPIRQLEAAGLSRPE